MKKGLVFASRATRIKVGLLDFLVGFVVPSVFWQIIFSEILESLGSLGEIFSGMAILGTIFVYWVLVPYYSKGQSLGKFLFHIRVIDISGNRLLIRQLIKRALAYFATIRHSIMKAEVVVDQNGRMEHDHLSNTAVIKEVD